MLVDSGESPTLEAAANTFASYGVRIVLGARIANSIVDQVIALTVINTAARSFLGNVEIVAPVDLQLTAPGFEGQPLTNFLDWAGVKKALPAAASGWPTIEVCEPGQTRRVEFARGPTAGLTASERTMAVGRRSSRRPASPQPAWPSRRLSPCSAATTPTPGAAD